MRQNNTWFFWDIGGVFDRFVEDSFLDSLSLLFRVKAEELLNFFREGDPSFWHRIESEPEWDARKIHAEFCERFGKNVSFGVFIRSFNAGIISADFDRELIRLLEDINLAGISQGIISNINSIHAECVEKNFLYILKHIPRGHRYYSYVIGARKSRTSEAFLKVFDLSDADPKNSYFIDDREYNIEGFERAGGTGILFHGYHDVRFQLKRRGLPLP